MYNILECKVDHKFELLKKRIDSLESTLLSFRESIKTYNHEQNENLISKITELQKAVFNVKEEQEEGKKPYVPQHICQDLVHMKSIKIKNSFLGWTLFVFDSSFDEDNLLDCFRIKSCPFCGKQLRDTNNDPTARTSSV